MTATLHAVFYLRAVSSTVRVMHNIEDAVLSRVRIQGYRSLCDVTLDLSSDVTVLVGANGSGKSNVLRALELIGQIPNSSVQETLTRWGGFQQQLYRGPAEIDDADRIDIELWEEDRRDNYGNTVSNGYAVSIRPAAEDSAILHEKFYYWDKEYDHPYEPGWGKGRAESRLADDKPLENDKENRIRGYVRPLIEGLQSFHFDDTSYNAPPLTTVNKADDLTLSHNASNLAAILYKFSESHRDVYVEIVWSIRNIAPFFDDFVLKPDSNGNILLRWRNKGSRSVLPGNALSSGTLRFICLSTLLQQPDLPQTIVLDEPELGLHPSAIVHFADLLREKARGRRIVVATQSVTMVNQFSVDELVIASRHEGQTVLERPKADELEAWLDDFTLGQLWEHNVLPGGYPRYESLPEVVESR